MKKAGLRKNTWLKLSITLLHEDTELLFYNSGMIDIKGDVKCGAIAFAKHILAMGKAGSLNYVCMKIHLKKDNKYSLEWIAEESDPNYKKPKFWEDFKREFERYCELKVFL